MTTLVLLPGMHGTLDLFDPLIAALPPDLKVVGIGYPPDQGLDYEALKRYVAAKLPAEPYVLLGESFSGPLSIAMAATRPPALRGLILGCTFAKTPVPWLSWLRPLVRLLPVARPPKSLFNLFMLGRAGTPQCKDWVGSTLQEVSHAAWRSRLASVLEVDERAALEKVQVPILYLQAQGDRVVGESALEDIRRLAPHTEVATFPGPHLLLQVQPEKTAAAIADFVRRVGQR